MAKSLGFTEFEYTVSDDGQTATITAPTGYLVSMLKSHSEEYYQVAGKSVTSDVKAARVFARFAKYCMDVSEKIHVQGLINERNFKKQ